jgi:ubiquinone/menaquinone biosynthesis C-methylase UbiE
LIREDDKLPEYSREPVDPEVYTESFDTFYSRFACLYDLCVKTFPFWKHWLRQALPYLCGPCVLEVSFGTGYLMTQYASHFKVYGIDYNQKLVRTAQRNLRKAGLVAHLSKGRIENLPYRADSFETVLNTMSLSGYPDGKKALSEMLRVLKPKGRLVIIDVNYPGDGNRPGTCLVNCWKLAGDIIRDMDKLFNMYGLSFEDREIGGWGSVHLYIANKAT